MLAKLGFQPPPHSLRTRRPATMPRSIPGVLAATLFCLSGLPATAQELRLRHDLEGPALQALSTLTVRFNDQQKGKGRIQLESLPPPAERRHLPQLALLDIAESREFFDTLPRFLPLHELPKASGEKLEFRGIFPQVADAADDAAGRLQALPLGLSLPVLYVNRRMLAAAGVDTAKPPSTWWELQEVAGKLYDSGVKCPLTSSDFSWLHLENLSSQHGQPVVLRQPNAERLMVNSLVNVKHIALLASWQKSRYFHYSAGREGESRFLAGECAMLTGNSSLFAEARRRGLDTGIHALPHYDDVHGASPADILPDGASLWVLAGLKKDQLQVAARFMRFLLLPENQRDWVKATTYLPMTPAAIDALRAAEAFPANLLAAAQKRLAMPSKNSLRPRLGGARERLRAILGEEILPVWNADRPAKEALDLTVQRANATLPPARGR